MLKAYKHTRTFDEGTVPAGLTRAHCTRSGTWADITVESGAMWVHFSSDRASERVETGGVVRCGPKEEHAVEPMGAVRFHVVFLRED